MAKNAALPKRKTECYARPKFVDRPSIRNRMAHRNIDGQILVDLQINPTRPDTVSNCPNSFS